MGGEGEIADDEALEDEIARAESEIENYIVIEDDGKIIYPW